MWSDAVLCEAVYTYMRKIRGGLKMPRTTSVPKSQKALPYFNYNDVSNAWFTIDEMGFYCNLTKNALLQLINQVGYPQN